MTTTQRAPHGRPGERGTPGHARVGDHHVERGKERGDHGKGRKLQSDAVRWFDRYASNDYARGFEYVEGSKVDFLTAFEVLEHLTDPISDLKQLMDLSDNVFVSTCIVPQPPPGLLDWWYYAPTTGQHIGFYTLKALEIIADRFDRKLLSNGSYHLFTKESKSRALFGMATKLSAARIVNCAYRRSSLVEADLQKMTR